MASFSVSDRAHLYYELNKLLDAGLSIPDAADAILDGNVPAGQRQYLYQLKKGIDEQKTIGESIEAMRGLEISKLEHSIIESTEEAGRLADGYDQLAEYFETRRNTAREIRSQLIYPVLLLHFAVLILMVPSALQGSMTSAVTEAIVRRLEGISPKTGSG